MRYRRRLGNQLNQSEVLAQMLYDEAFYSDLIKRWRAEYLTIQKINSKLIGMNPTGSKKEFIENIALYSVLELGQRQSITQGKRMARTRLNQQETSL